MRQHAVGECSQTNDVVQVEPLQHEFFYASGRVSFDLFQDHIRCPNDLVLLGEENLHYLV